LQGFTLKLKTKISIRDPLLGGDPLLGEIRYGLSNEGRVIGSQDRVTRTLRRVMRFPR